MTGVQTCALPIFIGSILSIAILSFLSSIQSQRTAQMFTWVIFLILSMCHLYANFRAVSSVVMETINDQRASLIAESIISSKKIPTPAQVAAKEKIFWRQGKINVELGCSLSRLTRSGKSLDPHPGEQFLISVLDNNKVAVVLFDGITAASTISAAVNAYAVRALLARGDCDVSGIVPRSREIIREVGSLTQALTTSGWNVSRLLVVTANWRTTISR